MQFKFFNIPINDLEQSGEELNKFLRSHRVLEVKQKLVKSKNSTSWLFAVKFLDSQLPFSEKTRTEKVDYREVLDEKTFAIYSRLRDFRKIIADTDGIPIYAVFTNEELANIARLPEISETSIIKVNGIGEKKTERFGKKLVGMYKSAEDVIIAGDKLF
jgi:superfamily II DNA helicase RecQ